MPALPDVPNVLRADLLWTVGSDVSALNRIHIKYTGSPPDTAAAIALAHALDTIFAAELAPYCNALNILNGVRVTDLSSPSGGQGEYLHDDAGTLGGNKLPAQTAGLASMGIARRYRGGKPRTYFPVGDSSVLLSEQLWATSFVANMDASLAAARADIAVTASGGCTLLDVCNVSYYSGFVVETNPITGRARNVPTLRSGGPHVDAATTWTFEQRLASQRRRTLRSS